MHAKLALLYQPSLYLELGTRMQNPERERANLENTLLNTVTCSSVVRAITIIHSFMKFLNHKNKFTSFL